MAGFATSDETIAGRGRTTMSKLLFRLRNVPEDEAEEVRTLLEENGLDYYETTAGPWGISAAAIWLTDDSQYEQARRLLDNYQKERTARQRALFERSSRRTLLDSFKEHPLRVVVYLIVIAGILYLSLMPFVKLGMP